MEEANENANVSMSKCIRDIPRTKSDVICELAIERNQISDRLAKLNKAIEANPEAVSARHKDLWNMQAKAMQEYVNVLGLRIKDLIDSGI